MQQQTSTNQVTNTMNQPPNVLSTKDLLYLEDMLSWNLIAMKKAHSFATQCTNPEVQNELNKVGEMHNKHYQQILQKLQSNNQQSIQ
ncbi:hypothetical protein LC087_10495 [Bacillus carboniphilus]|uniref:Spore coat protein n=1 Tax=Bacillus carboniphilus TaxID=86663 RepID=A0ABY9JPL2_9BACI|nr:hypothetical protein [Bacillus carboniphilus]WLR41346.1 hypothetical protein LC087_10495 [Bacillus carboniphilus]